MSTNPTLQTTYEAAKAAEAYIERLTCQASSTAGQTAEALWLCQKRDLLQAITGPVFLIPNENLVVLQAKVAKLNKTAAKLDCEPITLAYEPAEDIIIEHGENKGEVIERTYVAVKGSTPKLAGWSFVATLEHDEDEQGNRDSIIRRIPTFEGEVDLSAYRNATPENCDHCHTKRYRNDTYIVQHEDGTLKQVGSNCLKDFLGHGNPAAIARFCEHIASLFEEFGEGEEYEGFNGPSFERRIQTDFFMSHVACMIRENGWTSRGVARETGKLATADQAEGNIRAERKQEKENGIPAWTSPEDQDIATAEKAIAWVRNLTEEEITPTDRSDYLYNLYTVVKKDSIRYRQAGIAASAISAQARAEQRELQRKADAEGRLDEFIGEIKERRIFKFRVERVFSYESDYGYDTYYKNILRDETGAALIWNGSYGLEQGSTYQGKFTIKDHRESKYGKQTFINRPHGLEIIEEA